MKKISFPVLSVQEFRKLVLDHILNGMSDYTPSDIVVAFIESGVAKFDPDHLGAFVASLSGKVFLPTVAVDTGGDFIWLVSGSTAIVIKKTPISIHQNI